jgi:hypothetical protein
MRWPLVPIDPGDPLANLDAMLVDVEVDVEIVARQPRGNLGCRGWLRAEQEKQQDEKCPRTLLRGRHTFHSLVQGNWPVPHPLRGHQPREYGGRGTYRFAWPLVHVNLLNVARQRVGGR